MTTRAQAATEIERLEAICHAHTRLTEARHRLDLINKHLEQGKTWNVRIVLVAGDAYGRREITTQHEIHAAHVQQRAVDNVREAERALIKLGGTP